MISNDGCIVVLLLKSKSPQTTFIHDLNMHIETGRLRGKEAHSILYLTLLYFPTVLYEIE